MRSANAAKKGLRHVPLAPLANATPAIRSGGRAARQVRSGSGFAVRLPPPRRKIYPIAESRGTEIERVCLPPDKVSALLRTRPEAPCQLLTQSISNDACTGYRYATRCSAMRDPPPQVPAACRELAMLRHQRRRGWRELGCAVLWSGSAEPDAIYFYGTEQRRVTWHTCTDDTPRENLFCKDDLSLL